MHETVERGETAVLEDVLHILFRRKWLVIGLLVVAAAIFVYGTLSSVTRYKAEAIVMIRRLPLGYQMPAESSAVLRRDEVVNSEIQIIKSPAVAERVVDELGLDEERGRGRAIHNVATKIQAQVEPESNVIRIGYLHTDPEKAAAIANAALDAYLDVRASVAMDYDAVNYLETQAERIRADIDSIFQRIAWYGSERDQLERGRKGEQHMGLMDGVNNDIIDLKAIIYSQREKIALTEEWLESGEDIAHAPASYIYDMSTVRQAKLTLLAVKMQLEEAKAKYPPGHPTVKRYEREVEGAERIVRTEVEQALMRRKLRLEEWEAELAAKEKVLADLHSGSKQISEDTVVIRMLEHDLSIKADLYAVVMDRREQYKITAATDPSLLNIGVVSRARVPVVPWRSGVNMVSVFAVFTLLFGIALIFAIERLDQTLVRPVDIEQEVGLRVLASVRAREAR